MATGGGGFGAWGQGGGQAGGGFGGSGGGFGFGQQQQQQPGGQAGTAGGFSGFGAGGTAAPTSGLGGGSTGFGGFGSGAATGSTGASAFGQAPAPAPAFGGFGSTPAPTASGFGTPATSAFGTPAPTSGAFGTPAPSTGGFGTPAPTTGGFGTPTQGTSGFGGGFGTAGGAGAATPAPASGFGAFGSTATPQPGGLSTTGFGQTTTGAFGQPAQAGATSGFGQPAQGGAFGQPAQSSTSSPFGATTSAFGQPAQPAATGFGQPAQTGATGAFGQPAQAATPGGFGQTAATGGFGQTATTGFGQTATPGGFGQPAQGAATGGFGQAATTGGFGQAATTGGFGQTATTGGFGQTATPGGFGQPAQAGATGGFGQPAQTTTPGGFGQAATTGGFGQAATTGGFGQAATTGAFGQQSAQAATSAFGAPAQGAATSAFGQPAQGATSAFGATQQQPASTTFGGFGASTTPAPGASPQPAFGGFGASTTGTASAFGAQPAQAGQQPATGFGTSTGTGLGGFGAASTSSTTTTPTLGGGLGAGATGFGAGTAFGQTQQPQAQQTSGTTGGFGFGGGALGGAGTAAPTSSAATTAPAQPSAFSFGAATTAPSTPATSTTTSTTTGGLTGIGQAAAPAPAPASGGFSFGATATGAPGTTPAPAPAPSSGFSFGGAATTAATGGTAGAPAPAPAAAPSAFSFGSSTQPSAPAPAPGATPSAASLFPTAPAPAPATTTAPAPAPATGFSFGAAPSPAPAAAPSTSTTSTSSAAAPTGFSFGAASTSTTATATAPAATVPKLSVSFGAPAAPAPGPAPAPAPAPSGGLAGFGTAQAGAATTQPAAPAPAPAPAVTFGASGGFQFGAASASSGGAGLGAAKPATTTPATGGGAGAPSSTAGGAGGLSLFGGAAAGGGPTTTVSASGGAGGGVFGGAAKDATGAFGSRGRRQVTRAKVILNDVYGQLRSDECMYWNDRQISEAFDRLATADGSARDTLVRNLESVLSTPDFMQRASTFLMMDNGYYRPPSDRSRDELKAFEAKQAKMHLFPTCKEVDSLPGGKEELEGLRCLSKFLQLEERRALQVLHAYQRDQFIRGLSTEIDLREYSSLFFYERVRRFYFNQRVYMLKIIQELFRIDQDQDYFAKEIRTKATQILESMDSPPGTLAQTLKTAVERLCRAPVPGVQDLNPQPSLRYRASAEWWERQRRDWVEQGLVELQEVLSLFVLALSNRSSLGLSEWQSLVDSWYQLDLGALKPDRRYMLDRGVTQQRERRVSGMMMLILVQAMQLDALQGSSYDDHPFVAGLQTARSRPLDPILKALHDGKHGSTPSSPQNTDQFWVLVMFWSCFIHLTEPLKRSLQSPVKEHWGEAVELYEKANNKGAFSHLAETFRVLLDPPQSGPVDTSDDPRYTSKDLWSVVGLQSTLRRLADSDRRPSEWDRPDIDTLKYPMAEAIVALLSACYQRRDRSRPMRGSNRLVGIVLQYYVFLVAKVFNGSKSLCDIFWKSAGKASTPLSVLWHETSKASPLLFFHLACAAAADPVTAAKAVERLEATLCSTSCEPRCMSWQGNQQMQILVEEEYFDHDRGIGVPKGMVGENQAQPGCHPVICWRMTMWAALVRQLEAFTKILHDVKIVRVVKRLEAMREEALNSKGNTLGWNTIIDKFPSLFVFGPVTPTTDDFMKEVVTRGAWPVMAYCLGRVEMVLDQLALLLVLSEQSGEGHSTLSSLSRAAGVTMPGELPLWKRLPVCLLRLVQAASDAMSGHGDHQAHAQALVTVQASALNLLEKLGRVERSEEWRAEALRALVVEVEDRVPAVVAPRIPFIVWLGQRSIETERTLSQFRIARDAVRLMQNLIEQSCGMSWRGNEQILPLDAADSFIIRLVDFTCRVLLTLDTWTFRRNLDRWLLALACVQTLATFLRPPFKAEDPSSKALETHRQALLRRFRHDRVLFRALLRCIEHVPISALQAALEAHARRRPPFRSLDQLQPDHDDEDEREDDEDRGLFLSQGSVLPLRFDQGVVATATAEERQLLDQLGVESLDLLQVVVEHYVDDEEDTVAGALELLIKNADLPLPKAAKWAGARRPLVSHLALLASLVSYSSRRFVEGRPARSLAEVSLTTMSKLTRFMRTLHRRKKQELEKAITGWPQGLPLPFSPGVIDQMLSVTNARGFRRALLQTLGDADTPPEVVMAGLDFLVDAMTYQPSLARHLLFSQRGQPGAADEVALESVMLVLLERGSSLISSSDAEEDKMAWPFMAMTCRALYVILRSVSWRQSLDMMSSLSDVVWSKLSDALNREVGTKLQALTDDYCAMLSVQRYALDAFAWATAIASSKDEGPLADAARKKATAAVKALTQTRLLTDPNRLKQSLDSRFQAGELETEERAIEKAGLRRLERFRMPDWEEQLKDGNPRRYGGAAFIYDLAAVKRALHGGGETGKGRSKNDVENIQKAIGNLNRRYSAATAQHMVNKSLKAVVQILILRLGATFVSREVPVAALGRQVMTVLLTMLLSPPAAAQGSQSELHLEDLHLNDPYWTEDRRRERRAERLDLIRRMRQPKLELLLTLLTVHAQSLSRDEAKKALLGIEQAFNQLLNEGVDPLSSEALQLDLRQCLLSSALRILTCPALRLDGEDSPAKIAPTLLKHAVASISLLDTSLLGEQPAASTFHSERVESVLTSSVTLVSQMLPSYWGDRAAREDGGHEESKGGDGKKEDFSDLERAEAEAMVVEEIRAGQVMRRVLTHYTAASAMAARAFATLHDYTAVEVGRTIAVAELKSDPQLERARRRLTCLMRFLLACATRSTLLCQEMVSSHIFHAIAEDPLFNAIADTVEGSSARAAKDLLYQRGYMADGEESPYYSLWVNAVRLVAVLLHRLTRPYVADGAALPSTSGRQLATFGPKAPDEGENRLLAEVAALVGQRKRLLLWPLGENKTLTMALLKEAEAVMVLVREMGIHMHSWRTTDLQGFEALRETVKSLICRSVALLGRFVVADRGVVLSIIEESFFVCVSKAELAAKQRWRERRTQNLPAEEGDPEASAEDSFVRVLAAAMAFLRYTGPLRLPRYIPLTPTEAERTSFAEGTRVLYLDPLAMMRSEGIIVSRRLEYRYSQEHLVGTYTIAVPHQRAPEEGVQPRRIIAVEDDGYLERAAQDLDFELPFADVTSHHLTHTYGRLSVARIVILSKFCLKGLQTIGEPDGRTAVQKAERQAYLQKVLEHSLFLLLQVTPGMCLGTSSISKKDRQVLLATVAEVLDLVVDWRWPGFGGHGKKEVLDPEEEVNQRMVEELKSFLQDDADRCLKKDCLSKQEVDDLDRHLVRCGKREDLLELGMRCVELRKQKTDGQLSLRTYAAVLHAAVELRAWSVAVSFVQDMLRDSLTRIVAEVQM